MSELIICLVVVSVAGLAALTPRLRRLQKAAGVPSRTDRLIGKLGEVTEAIEPTTGAGRVLVAGQDWAAKSHQPLPQGAAIIVHGADGIVLTVAPK